MGRCKSLRFSIQVARLPFLYYTTRLFVCTFTHAWEQFHLPCLVIPFTACLPLFERETDGKRSLALMILAAVIKNLFFKLLHVIIRETICWTKNRNANRLTLYGRLVVNSIEEFVLTTDDCIGVSSRQHNSVILSVCRESAYRELHIRLLFRENLRDVIKTSSSSHVVCSFLIVKYR